MTTKQKIACIDTQILSYIVLKDPRSADFTERAFQLLTQLYDQDVSVIVPTLAVSELLVAYAPHEQNGVRAVIEQDFRIVPFDNLAAVHAARVYRANKENGRHAEVRAKHAEYPRQKLKVDHMIVGVAIANKADMLYTNDQGLYDFAVTHTPVMMLPSSSARQLELS